jgi:hypothetical protein
MIIRRLFFILIFPLLTSCSFSGNKITYFPDNEILNDAMVGVPYSQKITILGGPVIGGVHRNIGFISPNNSGLFLRNCERPRSSTAGNTDTITRDYNCVEIYGTPTNTETIKVTIGGATHPSMIVASREFSRDYIVNVGLVE